MALLEFSEVQAVSWEVWVVDSAAQVVSGGSVVEGSFSCDLSFQMVFFLSSLFDRLNEEEKPVGPIHRYRHIFNAPQSPLYEVTLLGKEMQLQSKVGAFQ